MIFKEVWDKYCSKVGGTGGRPDYAEHIYNYASELQENSIIVEIGTAVGGSAICMAAGLKGDGHIYTMDPNMLSEEEIKASSHRAGFSELSGINIYNDLRSFIDKTEFKDKITLLPGFSSDVYRKWDKGKIIDFLYIDGSHTYEATKEDLLWIDFLKVGGIVAIDDWIIPVKLAFEEWNERNGFILEHEHKGWPIRFRKLHDL